MFRALEKSDVRMLRAVLASGVVPDDRDDDPLPPLMAAVAGGQGDIEILNVLQEAGADPAATCRSSGESALHGLAGRARPDVLNWFLARDIDVNHQAADGATPLMRAIALAGWTEVPGEAPTGPRDARILLDAGADVGLANAKGQTALHLAAAAGLDEIARRLLDRGAGIDVPDAAGATPLLVAAENGRGEVVRTLLAAGANPNVRASGQFGALHDIASLAPEAMTPDRLEIAAALIAAGAEVDLADADGRSALCWASSYNNIAVARLLLRHGADAGALGGYALREAVFYGYDEMCDALLAAGANPAGAGRSEAPVLVAAREGYGHGLAALLDRGADMAATNADGETALLVAARRGHHAAVELLLRRGADPLAVDSYGNSAQGWAARRQDSVLVLLLSQAAAG